MKEKLKIKASVTHHDTAYWIKNEDIKEDGPFCQRCYDKNTALIRLKRRNNNNYYDCPKCKNRFLVGLNIT